MDPDQLLAENVERHADFTVMPQVRRKPADGRRTS
jgi:hypothetical protein